MRFETLIRKIEEEWKELELTIIPYKMSDDTYILVEQDAITSIIEDHLTTLESLL
jgi:hypothetical protein